ncbi:MAG: ThuA domain-containing protein [Gemmataceae bacterium]|nr:ThuA domain-containing protein [Gemmataceae bacterium]MCI0743584.1 ThuA domain-containing protein [Gemmataceae bacterium]
MNRLISLLALGVVLAFHGPALAQGDGAGKRLLVITESRGFRHGCVTRETKVANGIDPLSLPKEQFEFQKNKEGKVTKIIYTGRFPSPEVLDIEADNKVIAKVTPCVVEKTFMELAKKHNFTVVCSQNSRKEIDADNLKNFDAVFFYTTGELPLSDVQKADFLAFVRNGKGLIGSHCAADTFYKWRDYGEMIGAYFAGHPPGIQKIRIQVEDRNNPATKHFPQTFDYDDEIYQFKDPYSRDKLRVLMSIDMKVTTKNLWRKDGDNPLAWVRDYGKGRVFYTALGHRDEVWHDPQFQQHVIGGLRFVFGLENADTTPSSKRN